MRVVIQVAAKDRNKAWALLVRHSAGTALADGTFIVSEEAVRALRQAGMRFREISRESGEPTLGGKVAGERI
jgi:hypothetical protein